MRKLLVFVTLALAACGNSSNPTPDADVPRDDLSGTGVCAQSLAQYCAVHGNYCPSTLPVLENDLCATSQGLPQHSHRLAAPCDGFTVVVEMGIDSSITYFFDASAKLVAVVDSIASPAGTPECVAGPVDFDRHDVTGCSGATEPLCSTADGGI
jgi:hypothetical protein